MSAPPLSWNCFKDTMRHVEGFLVTLKCWQVHFQKAGDACMPVFSHSPALVEEDKHQTMQRGHKGVRRGVFGDYNRRGTWSGPAVLRCPHTSGSITWELVQHADFQVPPHTCWIRKVERLCFNKTSRGFWFMPKTEPLVIQEGLPEKVTSTKLEKHLEFSQRGGAAVLFQRKFLALERTWAFWETEISPMW